MFISRCDAGTVDQPCGAVHANVRFHAKVPLPGFESLVHLWITRFVLIFGGTRCGNNGGIHDDAAAQLQAVSLQQLTDPGKDGCAQVVFLSRWQKFSKVVASGTPSRPRSTLQKSLKAAMSYSASSQASSARLNQLATSTCAAWWPVIGAVCRCLLWGNTAQPVLAVRSRAWVCPCGSERPLCGLSCYGRQIRLFVTHWPLSPWTCSVFP